mmetsp:Transcript_30646/g.31184  ORF Transcript_30646/g.31184 Transcript_30646/m.31184 type:complete len:321 (+) Transcript_30646:116-1078(+)|eukprot:CAMPEP_0182428584 /NCGR_PEP_ID=MMETSP1167-20130531/23129_1 /TAXON_ID=2988 /ORGANISM="Mallomonas Sp, Strain CCMP3275" /LENGTH=320 /DNA_ID=CAMNT_0024611557 /DNA_START=113 /DNA_END=1075 /DNA_ORIENTATION=-
MKRFDIHVKTIDGVHQQTILGAFTTLVSVILVSMLITSEVQQYLKKDIVNHMGMDNSVGVDSVKIVFDLSFPAIACDRISVVQEVTRGTLHEHGEPLIVKEEDHNGGCHCSGKVTTDKVAGNFRFVIGRDANTNEVKTPSRERGFDVINPPDLSHHITYLWFMSTDEKSTNLRDLIASSSPSVSPIKAMHGASPLDGQATVVPTGTGLYQYSVQVIQTEYRQLGETEGGIYNQYAVNERQVEMSRMFDGVMLNGQHFRDFVGIVFAYDFYPVMLVMEETKEPLTQFLASLCGIVGGLITVLGLLDRMLYTSQKALIGKKD